MGRGAQAQTRQLTDQQLANINALNQQFLGQQQQVGNLLVPQFQSILNNPGLSPADKAAVTGQSQAPSPAPSIRSPKPRAIAPRAPTIPPASANLRTTSRARRESPKGTRPRKTSSPSATPPFSGRWPRCKASPASSAWTPISSAAPSASPPNCSVSARTPPAPAASSVRSARRSAAPSARSPALCSSPSRGAHAAPLVRLSRRGGFRPRAVLALSPLAAPPHAR